MKRHRRVNEARNKCLFMKDVRMNVTTKVVKSQVEKDQAQLTEKPKALGESATAVRVTDDKQKEKELTPQQAATLSKLERKIETAQRSFIAIADALRQVRDEQLFLAHYKTFRAYMAQRWEFDYATQSRMEDAIEVLAALRKHKIEEKDLPGNEGQARQLARVLKKNGEEALVQVWEDDRGTAEGRGLSRNSLGVRLRERFDV